MSTLYSVAISIIYSLSCLGIGWIVAIPFRRWHADRDVTTDVVIELSCIASSYLIGAAVYAAVLTILGIAGVLDLLFVVLTILPGTFAFVIGAIRRRHVARAVGASFASLRYQPVWVNIVVFLLLTATVGFGVAAWFTPPKGDAAAFYLVYPKIIAATGTLIPMPGIYESFSMIGLSAEYHFAALMVLADVGAAKLFIFPAALAVAALLAGLIRACGGGLIAIVLGYVVLLTSSTVHLYVFDGKVDILPTAFGLAAIYWLFVPIGPEARYPTFALSGFFAGLATVAKFSFIPTLGISLLLLLFWRVSIVRNVRQDALAYFKVFFLSSLVMAGATLVGWLPQFLKNAALFGAPLAPFLGNTGSDALFSQVWFSTSSTWQIVLTYPLALVYGRYPMQGGGLSFLLLCFLPLLFWGKKPFNWHHSRAGILALAGLAAVVVWVVLRPSVIAPRYVLASLLLFVPLFVIKVEELLRDGAGPAFLRLGVTGSVIAAITASCWQLLPLPSALAAAARGVESACLLAAPECTLLRAVSAQAAPGDRMLVATYYAYWLDASHLQCRDQGGELSSATAQPNLIEWMQSRAFRYAVIDSVAFPELASKFAALATSTGEIERLPQGKGDAVHIYRINLGETARLRCVNTSRDRWILIDATS